ncbi:MAG TPA: prepilin-type N-terminal cleavage/methylation domain-containing protein [Candidatus Hydrogenedentes bacterium]|nr:prepilin-type N-terminal cleavage/methylation domain-containing protein [Candidatus Hydrogenedentota bacterium]
MRDTCTITTPDRTAHAGFSLMELVVVLTLLTIIMGAVVPVFNGSFKSVHSDYVVRDLIAMIKYGQERAITDTTRYRLYLDPEQRQYWLMRLEDTDEGPLYLEDSERFSERRTLPDGVEMDRPHAYEDRDLDAYFIEFHPSGRCDDASIDVLRQDGDTIRIETEGNIGQIKVKGSAWEDDE